MPCGPPLPCGGRLTTRAQARRIEAWAAFLLAFPVQKINQRLGNLIGQDAQFAVVRAATLRRVLSWIDRGGAGSLGIYGEIHDKAAHADGREGAFTLDALL